ncbi:MAG: sigma-70 family RNA polymerase sigma factor [Alphaproteobacteria bacterium]|nr:sigma-70 family RNA polymerase sigma factor [Alphaproteobacteria bacterium]
MSAASPDPTVADVPLEDREDEDLVLLLRDQDCPQAFAVLVHRHSGRLYAIAMGMVRNEQDARDCVQETFLAVHRKLDGFRGDASFKTWVSRITTNNALMKLRRRRRKPETSLMVVDPEAPEEGPKERDVADLRPLADQVHENRELGDEIRRAVDALPDKYREVLILADYQHLSMKDIADTLGLTVPNVKTRLHRARLAVRDELKAYVAGER